MKLVLVLAVLAIILSSTTGINSKKFGSKSIGCRGDLNATSGCDKTCKRRCPGPKPEVCECPKKNSCMCRMPYVYDPTKKKCVKLKDCASPITEEETTTECITTEDESTTEDDTTTDCITTTDEPTTEENKTTTECIDTTDEPTTECIDTTYQPTTECFDTTDEPTTECIDITDEPTTECIDTTDQPTTECIDTTDEPTTECIDTTDEPTTECIDTTDEPTTECIDTTDEPTTECVDTTDEPTTECNDTTGEPTTECIDTTDEPTTECIDTTDEPTTECIDEYTTENDDDCEDYTPEPVTTTVEITFDCDDYDDTTTSQPITTTHSNDSSDKPCQCSCNCPGTEITTQEPTITLECDDETTTECDDGTTTECDDKTTTECYDETTTECDDGTTTECDDKTTTECYDETTTECDDKTTTECDDKTTTECDGVTTTECDNITTTECDDQTTTECDDKTTTECDEVTTTECDDITTTECDYDTTTEGDDITTTECEDVTTEAPTTTEVTTTEAIPILEECPEAFEIFTKNLFAFHLKFLYQPLDCLEQSAVRSTVLISYAITFPKISFSGAPLGPMFSLMFLLNFATGNVFSELSLATGLNTTSEIACVCNKINKNIYNNTSTYLAPGVAVAVRSNYTFTSKAERFMREIIIGKLITFSSSVDPLNEGISNLTNNKINNVINESNGSDQMISLSGVSLNIMIHSNKTILKPFFELPFGSALAKFTIVKGMYYFAECPFIQAKMIKIDSINGDSSSIIVLPYNSLDKHLEKITEETFQKCMQSMKLCLVNVELPQIFTNTSINTLKLIKYAKISSSLFSSGEYKNMLVNETRINLTKARQRTVLEIRSGEPLPPNIHDVHNIFTPQWFFIANIPHYYIILSAGKFPIACSVVASYSSKSLLGIDE